MAIKLGELLLQEERITSEQLQTALEEQRLNGGRLGSNLIKLGFVRDEEIISLLSRQYGVPAINLNQFDPDPEVVRLISAETASKYQVIPVGRTGMALTLAMADPTNVFAMDDIKFMTGLHVEPVVASEAAVLAAIGRYYARPGVTGKPGDLVLRALEDLGEEEDEQEQHDDSMPGLADPQAIDATALEHDGAEAPIVRLVSALLVSAIQRGASDVHVEPYESELRIRLRIDGVLYPIMAPPIKYRDPITSRLKIMANLDIAEKRLPQDGRLKVRFNDRGRTREIDFRVSSLPTLFGETIVLRVLDQEQLHLDMTRLGLEPPALAKFEAAIRRPWGMVLVTGPTGSGKTNTLYSAITQLNQPGVNILTAEDPVEFNIQGVNQVQVREQIGLTFAVGAPLVSPPGSKRPPGRRNPGSRDGRDCSQGGAHRPSRPLHAAHERCARHGRPARQHGDRAVPRQQLGQSRLRAAARATDLRALPRGSASHAGADPHARDRARRRGRSDRVAGHGL